MMMVLMALTSQAQPAATLARDDFTVQIWGTSEGLPANVILEIVQTPDDYLWLGTTHGLARFDGVRFETFLSTRLPHRLGTRVESLEVDPAGNLWIAAEQKGLLAFQEGQLLEFHRDNPALNYATANVGSDPAGWLWLVDLRGNLARISPSNPMRLEPVDFTLPPGARLLRGRGNLWAVSARTISGTVHGEWRTILESQLEIQAAAPGRKDGLWLASEGRLQWLDLDGNLESHEMLPWEPGTTRVTSLFEDRDGMIWIGTSSKGLFRRIDGAITQVFASPRAINCFAQDREGNLWAGTRGGGLARIRKRVFRFVDSRSGLPSEYINSIAEDSQGRIWLATEERGLGWLADGKWNPPEASRGWDGPRVFCLAPSRNGFWLATAGRGLWFWKDDEFTRIAPNRPLAKGAPRGLHEDRNGTLWLLLDNGLFSVTGREFQRHHLENGLNTQWIRALAEDAEGAIWVGDWRGGIWKFSNEKWQEMRPPASNAEAVRAMVFDDQGDLWIGTADAGLLRLRANQAAPIRKLHGLPGDDIAQMLLDDDTLWFATGKGLFHISLAQLNELADGRRDRIEAIQHGQGEGLPELHFTGRNQPRTWRTRHGDLWFATASGALHFHPGDLNTSDPPPQALVEEVIVGGQPQSRDALRRLRSDVRRLEFRFTAPSFSAPEHVRFRYQLEGVDDDWIEGGPHRSAAYASVPFGTHVFRVAACNAAGTWGPVAESVSLIITPYFWQTRWFIALVAGTLAGGMAWGARRATLRRLRRKLQLVEQKHALERERARISQDIHDELGASLTTIGLLADMGNRHKANPQALTNDLAQISEMARGTASAMDAIVWAINPRNDSLDHFANYVGQFTKDFFRPTSIRTRLDFPAALPPQPMSANTRHNLFLAVKESLNNVIRHAEATEVKLSLQLMNGTLQLTVEDNGKGMAGSSETEGQDGLINMQNRIEKLCGRLEVETNNGSGTRVSFLVPLKQLNSK
jgi:signal transduction histidine kinase/ligand-binding sensor domain-containing protein